MYEESSAKQVSNNSHQSATHAPSTPPFSEIVRKEPLNQKLFILIKSCDGNVSNNSVLEEFTKCIKPLKKCMHYQYKKNKKWNSSAMPTHRENISDKLGA